MEKLSAPLFKGATRPAMLFGVPMEVMIKVLSPFFLLAIFTFPLFELASFLFLIPFIFCYAIMRDLTKRDNQYMQMWFMELAEKTALKFNRAENGVRVLPPLPIRYSSLKEKT